ncbi:MAG: phenylacetate-CoA oxygenase/reductase subunit PaaK [Gammaproteobacteria bacterium]|nr:phenylacetate-CoA oxygenase/reductase subunit PaaK [Gammaproteobacteria bacterium]MCP5423527.1 phenylacetate-CoA oxygenase/reductase subunit PaaK [Gammaproteobacteria bacterium]
MNRFYPLTVAAVRRETRDAVAVTLDVPDEFKDKFRFVQGQYLTFRTRIDGEEVRRSYSICAAVQDPALRVGIKKVEGGLFSTWANEQLQPGQILEAMPPMGNFHVPLDPDNRKHYVAFAGGSGITPILGVLKTTLLSEPQSAFTLFYGNQASSGIMFREELEDLKNQYLGRFTLIHILDREQQDIDLFNGMLTKDKCAQLFRHWLDIKTVDTAFICGPQVMMIQVSEALQEHGLDKRQIKFELFTTGAAPKRAHRAQDAIRTKGRNNCEVTVILDGRARSFQLEKNTDTLLDAALKEGIELPYACKGGVCSTCRTMLVEGEVDMNANFALEDYEIARGHILACQSYPVTDKIVVDFDQ